MNADLEAVTSALADHDWLPLAKRCRCGEGESGAGPTSWSRYRAHLAAVLASLPDDRLAEAEAKLRAVEQYRRQCAITRMEPTTAGLTRALSGGDAT